MIFLQRLGPWVVQEMVDENLRENEVEQSWMGTLFPETSRLLNEDIGGTPAKPYGVIFWVKTLHESLICHLCLVEFRIVIEVDLVWNSDPPVYFAIFPHFSHIFSPFQLVKNHQFPLRPKCVIGAADPNNMCKTAFDTGAAAPTKK